MTESAQPTDEQLKAQRETMNNAAQAQPPHN